MIIRKREIAVVCLIFFIIITAFSMLKIVTWNRAQGDSSLYSQLLHNIITTGRPNSEVASNTLYYLFPNKAAMSLDDIIKLDLSTPPSDKLVSNFFTFHFYPFMYLLTPLRFIDTDILYPVAIVFSFFSLILIVYIYLRNRRMPIPTALLFLILILSYPAFSISIQGQLYPDRFFLGIALLFAFLCSSITKNKFTLILIAVLCCLVNERAGITLGIFSILHYILYYKKADRRSAIKLFIGVISIGFSYVVMKFFMNNSYYSGYLITSLPAYISYLNMPGVIEKISIFLLFSSMLWIISIFEWRAAAIALIMLLPNLLGNIGGAEKTGWLTHYHTYYFPFLIWASTVGLIKLYGKTKKWAANMILCALILLVCTKNPYTLGFSSANFKDNILVKTISEIKIYFLEGNAKRMMAIKNEFQDSIPAGSRVSAVESVWYPFYKTAHISYYPIGIEEADYVIITAQKTDGGYKYGGFVSYHGPLVTAEIDKYLLGKMKEYGYDLENPVYISPWGHAVIARKKL